MEEWLHRNVFHKVTLTALTVLYFIAILFNITGAKGGDIMGWTEYLCLLLRKGSFILNCVKSRLLNSPTRCPFWTQVSSQGSSNIFGRDFCEYKLLKPSLRVLAVFL